MKAVNDLKRELVRYGEKIYEEGLVIGSGGNISARLDGMMYLKASGISLKESMACDYAEVSLSDKKATAGHCRPLSIELPMHVACYRARPDIGAVVHTHPVYGSIAASITQEIGLVSYEFLVYMNSTVPVIKYIRPGTEKLAEAVKKEITSHNGVILASHGALVVGKDIKEAFFRALALERACKMLILSKISGKISLIPKSELKYLK